MSRAETLVKEIAEANAKISKLSEEIKRKTQQLIKITNQEQEPTEPTNTELDTKEKALTETEFKNKVKYLLNEKDTDRLTALITSIENNTTTLNTIVLTGKSYNTSYLKELLQKFIRFNNAWFIEQRLPCLIKIIDGMRDYQKDYIKPPNIYSCHGTEEPNESTIEFIGEICNSKPSEIFQYSKEGPIKNILSTLKKELQVPNTNFILGVRNETQIDLFRKYVPADKLHIFRIDEQCISNSEDERDMTDVCDNT